MLNPLLKSTSSHPPLWHQPLTSSFDFLNEASQADPGPESWGYLAHHSGGSCGPPVSFGVFLWFDSLDHMLQALVQGELRMELDSDDLDTEAQAKVLKMQAIADHWVKNPEERISACYDFSNVFHFLEVEWFGQFKELTLGDSDYAREVRMDFRESEYGSMSKEGKEDREAALPIRAEERPAFIERLSTWST